MAKYDKFTSLKNPNRPVQVESAIRDGAGKNIENNYAKQNGYYQTLKSGESDLADNLNTDKGSSVVDAVAQFDPISQAVEDGSYAKMDNMKGRSFVYNQIAYISVGVNDEHNGITYNNAGNNVLELSGTSTEACFITLTYDSSKFPNIVANHKYLYIINKKGTFPNNSVGFYNVGDDGAVICYYTQIKTYNASYSQKQFAMYIPSGVTIDGTVQLLVVDLTAMGLDSVTTVDEAFEALRSYGIEPTVYNEYSTGKIIDSQPNKIISRGINLWDEEYQQNRIWSTTDGTLVYNASYCASKNDIKVLPNTTYYVKNQEAHPDQNCGICFYDKSGNFITGTYKGNATFTTPSNCYIVRFYFYGTTYNHDITIAEGTTDPGYHAYVSDEHSLVLPVMRSAESVADDKDFVRVGSVDLGTLTWYYASSSSNPYFEASVTNPEVANAGELICTKYTNGKQYGWITLPNKHIRSGYGFVRIVDNDYTDTTAFKAAMSGVILNYEFATPVAQDPAISLPQNIKVWNGGSLETQYEAPNTTPGLISLTYQANIKNYIEGEAGREDINWNPNNVVSQAQLGQTNETITKIINGEQDVGKAKLADNLNTTKGLTVSDDPMSSGAVGGSQKSAVGDGNASLNKLVCVDVVRNQHVIRFDTAIQRNQFKESYDSASGILTLTRNSNPAVDNYAGLGIIDAHVIKDHYYIALMDVKLTTSTSALYSITANPSYISFNSMRLANGEWMSYKSILRIPNKQTAAYFYTMLNDVKDLAQGDTLQYRNVRLIDLTQRYGSNDVVSAIIGTGTSDEQVERLLAFDPEILSDTAHDAGTLVPSKTAKLLSVGVNQWDEQWEVGSINLSTGANESGSKIRSKNFIKVLSSTTYSCNNTSSGYPVEVVCFYDVDKNYLGSYDDTPISFATPANCAFIKFRTDASYGSTYNDDICINISDPSINGKYYPHKRTIVTLPNHEGHGILKVVDGKVVADGDELYPDGNSKKRYGISVFDGSADEDWKDYGSAQRFKIEIRNAMPSSNPNVIGSIACDRLTATSKSNVYLSDYQISRGDENDLNIIVRINSSTDDVAKLKAWLTSNPITVVYELATEQDISTPVYQSTFPVEQGGTLQFLDENDKPIAGLQGSEIFYQKNIKAFVEALGEATDWNPERIKRLGSLSFTPEYVNITLNPSPTGAYARAQVYNATFTIVISAPLTGTPNGSITFQDSEVDLSNFQTKPAESIYDMDGKKVSEEPTTTDCNIASFVGRSKGGIVLWSLLHSGVNKVKIHIEEAVPLDSEGKGKIDCRASLIL